MMYQYVLKLAAILLFLLPLHLNCQWVEIGDTITKNRKHIMRSGKIAPDNSVWITSNSYLTPFYPEIKDKYAKLVVSPDGRDSWNKFTFEKVAPGTPFDVSPIDSLTAFIALDTSGIYKTTNGGRDWRKLDSYPYRCLFVHFFDEMHGWAFSGSSDATFDTIQLNPIIQSVTSDGGVTWTHIGGKDWISPPGTSLPLQDTLEFTGPMLATNPLYDVQGHSIVIAMSNGAFWLSHDKGYNWSRVVTPLKEMGLAVTSVAMQDRDFIMVAGNYHTKNLNRLSPTGQSTVTCATFDGGKTWRQGPAPINAASLEHIPGMEGRFLLSGYTTLWNCSYGSAITYDYGGNWEFVDNQGILFADFNGNGQGITAKPNGSVFRWQNPGGEAPRSWAILQWYFILAACILLAGIAFYVLRIWPAKKKRKFNDRIRTLKTTASQAQISPEFILSSISAIHQLMDRNQKSLANAYLGLLSKLTRGILNVSSEQLIPLEDDIELLRNYLKLQRLRLNNRLEYAVSVDERIDLFDTMVPPLLIQSIVNNRIAQGMDTGDHNGRLTIQFKLNHPHLSIELTDNFITTSRLEGFSRGKGNEQDSILDSIKQDGTADIDVENLGHGQAISKGMRITVNLDV